MRQRPWLAASLMLAGAAGCVGLWRIPLTLCSGAASVPIGPETHAHDLYVSIPAGVPVACLTVVGLALLLSTGKRKDTA